MAIYDSLPYTNFHELNADWLLKQMKEAKAKVDDIQAEIDRFNATYAALAAAFTIAGSNISTTKNFSAASLTGPLTGNVTGNLTGNVTGDVTGNVTGNVTGDVTGNADTATNATNATNATHATSADSATTATNATNATNAAVANRTLLDTTVNSTDANDYIPDNDGLHVYQADALNSNVPGSQQGEAAVLLTIRYGTDHVLQVAWFYVNSQDLYYRQKYYSSWQGWYKITATQAL